MAAGLGKEGKKEAMKDIILQLHRGLSVEQAKARFLEEVGNVSSVEIAEIEQSLIDEGLPAEEIRKFCNVHALLFESSLREQVAREESPAHPVYLLRAENREIEKLLEALKEAAGTPGGLRRRVGALLERLRGIDTHYTRKEQVLFPYLERHAFMGPSTVMWGKDDEIRGLLQDALAGLASLDRAGEAERYRAERLEPLIQEVEGMIFKEETILLPTALEKLTVEEWAAVLKESEEVGYAFIEKPKETAALADQLLRAYTEEPTASDPGHLRLASGQLSVEQLVAIFDTLPVDITFIDHEDRVRYFSEGPERIFLRTRSILGRKVQNCHPPKSVEAVNRILEAFRSGTRSKAEFWIRMQNRFALIRYFAVRGRDGTYLGTLEVSQDIAPLRELQGERRLLDWK